MEVTRIARLSDGGRKESAAAQFSADNETEEKVVNVYNATRQKILGFGGAFTDSAAYNYSLLSPEEKQKTLELLFGKTGLKYNFCRIPMASSDFSLYMYDNVKDGGRQFDITEDEKYKIPFISDALRYTDGKMTFFASPWSPPAFMKDNGDRLHGGSLMEKYYGDWADAFCAFIRGYERHSIKISAVTLQNEPHAVQTWKTAFLTPNRKRGLRAC